MSEIELKNISFSYEKSPILKNVSFSVKKGSFNAIIGPNGGGKTTLLKLLLGLINPEAGSVLIQNTSPQKIREKISYVPQTTLSDPFFPITLLQVVLLGYAEKASFFSKYSKPIMERAYTLIEEMGLTEHTKRPFGALSGGLKQRTLIARALLSDPEFLFLDEPTASIDKVHQEKIFSIIESYKGKKTILMVTHDLEEIFKNVDTVFSCQKTVTPYSPEQVCKHFASGLYHTPLS